jgi:hypothetical protein
MLVAVSGPPGAQWTCPSRGRCSSVAQSTTGALCLVQSTAIGWSPLLWCWMQVQAALLRLVHQDADQQHLAYALLPKHTCCHLTAPCCAIMSCTALFCTALSCTVLHCTVLHCTVLQCTVSCSHWGHRGRGGWQAAPCLGCSQQLAAVAAACDDAAAGTAPGEEAAGGETWGSSSSFTHPDII